VTKATFLPCWLRDCNAPINSKVQHPPRATPRAFELLKIGLFKFPSLGAKKLFKCPTNWRARWKKGVSDDLRLKSKLLLFSWTLAHRLVFMWGTPLRTYFLTWDLKFEELAYYFCVKSVVELNSLKWCVKDFFCSLPELKQRNST